MIVNRYISDYQEAETVDFVSRSVRIPSPPDILSPRQEKVINDQQIRLPITLSY